MKKYLVLLGALLLLSLTACSGVDRLAGQLQAAPGAQSASPDPSATETAGMEVFGYVMDDGGALPLEGADVSIVDGNGDSVYRLQTDADGYYSMELTPGSYSISISKRGYETQSGRIDILSDAPYQRLSQVTLALEGYWGSSSVNQNCDGGALVEGENGQVFYIYCGKEAAGNALVREEDGKSQEIYRSSEGLSWLSSLNYWKGRLYFVETRSGENGSIVVASLRPDGTDYQVEYTVYRGGTEEHSTAQVRSAQICDGMLYCIQSMDQAEGESSWGVCRMELEDLSQGETLYGETSHDVGSVRMFLLRDEIIFAWRKEQGDPLEFYTMDLDGGNCLHRATLDADCWTADSGGTVYYCGDGSIQSCDLTSGKTRQLAQTAGENLLPLGGNLYFLADTSDSVSGVDTLCRVPVEGGAVEQLVGDYHYNSLSLRGQADGRLYLTHWDSSNQESAWIYEP